MAAVGLQRSAKSPSPNGGVRSHVIAQPRHDESRHTPGGGVSLGPLTGAVGRREIATLIVCLAIGVALAWLPLALAAVFLFGAIGLLVILRQPVWGLCLLVPVIPFSPLVSLQIAGVNVGGMEALLALILVAWLMRMAVRHEIIFPHPPLLLPWLLWLGVILASWTQAPSLGAALTESAKWVEMLALFLFVVANVERRHLPWLLAAFLLAGAAEAVLGLYQFTGRVGPEGFLIWGGHFLRAYGTFGQPNPYAGYLGLTLPLAYSLALCLPISRWLQGWGRVRSPFALREAGEGDRSVADTFLPILAVVSAGLMLAAGYASQSRGAWIGIAGAFILVSVVRSRRAALVFAMLAAAVAIVAALGAFNLLPATVVQRFADVVPVTQIPNIATAEVTDANFPAIERLAHWQAALAMWRDHLWLGVGSGNYPVAYPAYAVGRWRDPLGHAHNAYLNTAAETGLLGLIAYGAFWLAALWLGWRAARGSQGLPRAVAVGGLGVLVHLSLHSTFDSLFVQGMYLHIAIVLGLLAWLVESGRNLGQVTREGIDNPSKVTYTVYAGEGRQGV
jgi:O-antigen ligase